MDPGTGARAELGSREGAREVCGSGSTTAVGRSFLSTSSEFIFAGGRGVAARAWVGQADRLPCDGHVRRVGLFSFEDPMKSVDDDEFIQ